MANNAEKLKKTSLRKARRTKANSAAFSSPSLFLTSLCTNSRVENTHSIPADDGGSVKRFIAKVDIPSSNSPVIALQIPIFINEVMISSFLQDKYVIKSDIKSG